MILCVNYNNLYIIFLKTPSKGSGLKLTLKYLERVGVQWGGFNAGKIRRDIRTIDKWKDLSIESLPPS